MENDREKERQAERGRKREGRKWKNRHEADSTDGRPESCSGFVIFMTNSNAADVTDRRPDPVTAPLKSTLSIRGILQDTVDAILHRVSDLWRDVNKHTHNHTATDTHTDEKPPRIVTSISQRLATQKSHSA